jgi:hypothetical protein
MYGSGEPANLSCLKLIRVGGALRAPRRQSLLRSQARCALLPAATPRLMGLRQPRTCRVPNSSVAATSADVLPALGLQLIPTHSSPTPRTAPTASMYADSTTVRQSDTVKASEAPRAGGGRRDRGVRHSAILEVSEAPCAHVPSAASTYTGIAATEVFGIQEHSRLAKPHQAGGRRGKERVASLRAQQRLAAGGPQGSPDPYEFKAYHSAGSRDPEKFKAHHFAGSPDPYMFKALKSGKLQAEVTLPSPMVRRRSSA